MTFSRKRMLFKNSFCCFDLNKCSKALQFAGPFAIFKKDTTQEASQLLKHP